MSCIVFTHFHALQPPIVTRHSVLMQAMTALRGEHLDVALQQGPLMVSIAEAESIRAERLSESRTRAAETRKRCSVAATAAGAAQGGSGAD